MAYPTITDIKTYLGRTDTLADAKLTQVLNRAITFVENHTGQMFGAPASFTQVTQGDGSDLLRPAKLPISEIVSITENGILLEEGTDKDFMLLGSSTSLSKYVIKRLATVKGSTIDMRYLPLGSRRSWYVSPGSISLVYKAGMTTTPSDISGAIVELTAILSLEKRFTFTTDEGVDRTIIQTSVPEHIMDILNYNKVMFV